MDEEQRRSEQEITGLALSYRAGDRSALGPLHDRLRPWIAGVIRSHSFDRRSLPADVDVEDLGQQAYVALAEAVMEWQPERNASFVPYFMSSFPWRIDRYLRAHTPLRRTARFKLLSVPHDSLMEQAAAESNLDGREWDGALIYRELMAGLPESYARVVRLHAMLGLSFTEVGLALGMGRSTAHEFFTRAASLLRARLEEPEPAARRNGSAPGGNVDVAAIRRCVETMHRLAPRGARLPGRDVMCRTAGLTQGQYRQIMERLGRSGCLVGRRQGSPGSLAHSAPDETMRALGLG